MLRPTVLVVEDHDDLRTLFSEALAIAGYVVRQASNGLEALRLLDSAPPDIVVLDLGLPHVSGYDVLFELKAHSHTKGIPVVVVTAYEEPIEGIAADCVLRKPVRPEDLVGTVHRCLNTRK